MNHDSERETDALRSNINETRQRMDETLDDLGERFQPRHLVDEFLGYLRGENGEGHPRMDAMREKLSRGASRAASSVVDTIKENPVPALLIGAGVAWMIYESRRDKPPRDDRTTVGSELLYDPDVHYDRPLEYPTSFASNGQPDFNEADAGDSKLDQLKEKAGDVAERAKEKLSSAKDYAGEKLHAARDRAAEMGARVKEKAGAAYTRTRERVVSTADHHPLEVGLCCLAAGLIAGVLLPTPSAVDRVAGPTAQRLRQRARTAGTEALAKGKRVARAAADAAKTEAKAQGLTMERTPPAAAAPNPASNPPADTAPTSGSSDPNLARPAV